MLIEIAGADYDSWRKTGSACVPVRPGFCRCASDNGGYSDKERRAIMIARPEGPCPGTITGRWNFYCCSGKGGPNAFNGKNYKYSATLDLQQAGNVLTGTLAGDSITGTVMGNSVNFHRNQGGAKGQDYSMTVSGNRMTGTFKCNTSDSCDSDTGIGTDVVCQK